MALELTEQQKLLLDRLNGNLDESFANGTEYPPATQVVPPLQGYSSSSAIGNPPVDYRPAIRNPFKSVVGGLLTSVDSLHTPTLLNSWVYFGAPYSTPAYYIDPFGRVFLKGLIKNGTLTDAAFQLPAGYRPNEYLINSTVSFDGVNIVVSRVDVDISGNVIPYFGGNTWFSLNGVSFLAQQ